MIIKFKYKKYYWGEEVMNKIKNVFLIIILIFVYILILGCSTCKNDSLRLQSFSPVWYGKDNIRLFPLFYFARGEGKINFTPYLIKSVDEGMEFVFLHPLNWLIDFPLIPITCLIGRKLEGPDLPFCDYPQSIDFGWVFFIKNKDTFAFRITPLIFLHFGNMYNSKYFKNLKGGFPKEETPMGDWSVNIISSFPLFHISNTEKIGKPKEHFQNISLLWFVYWHWKIDIPYQWKSPTARTKEKISHFLIFFEKKTEKVWDTKN